MNGSQRVITVNCERCAWGDCWATKEQAERAILDHYYAEHREHFEDIRQNMRRALGTDAL